MSLVLWSSSLVPSALAEDSVETDGAEGKVDVGQGAGVGAEEEDEEEDIDDESDVGGEHGEDEEEEEGDQKSSSAYEDNDEEERPITLTGEQLQELFAVVMKQKKIEGKTEESLSLEEVLQFAQATAEVMAEERAETIMNQTDTNKDLSIDLSEYLAHLEGITDDDRKLETERFEAADINQDSLLSKEELAAAFTPDADSEMEQAEVEELLKHGDKDGDGRLSKAEFEGSSSGVSTEDVESFGQEQLLEQDDSSFAIWDQDEDGFITVEELQQARSEKDKQHKAFAELFQVADVDGNFRLTPDELHRAAEKISECSAAPYLGRWADHYGLLMKAESNKVHDEEDEEGGEHGESEAEEGEDGEEEDDEGSDEEGDDDGHSDGQSMLEDDDDEEGEGKREELEKKGEDIFNEEVVLADEGLDDVSTTSREPSLPGRDV